VVLVVDDEPGIRTVLARLLEAWDFKVVEAEGGPAALEAARRLNGAISMVITDVVMPDMDGYELAGAFRTIYPSVPILFISGYPDATVGWRPNSMEQLIFKPFNPDEFLNAVARLLQSRIHERPSRT
jgi:two-component system cell cycle sensor histidine kinase/response regulator CckA